VKEDLTGIDMLHLIGTSLQAAKDLVKEGSLSLGETAEIQLNLPDYPLIKAVLGRSDSVQVLYIDQNYKLVTETLVVKPSVVVLFGMDRLGRLWEKLDEDYTEETNEEAEGGTAFWMMDEILSRNYPDCVGKIFLASHLMMATFTMAV